jgi:predicted metal-dependent enzyme (double-stranded beta helix superfamily)
LTTTAPRPRELSFDLPGRDLEPVELAELAESIAGQPDLWLPLVRHDPDQRRYESLYVDPHVGIWVISWMPGHDTGFHDHDVSSGGVAVASGMVAEERPRWGRSPERVEPGAGESIHFDNTEIHRMEHVGTEPAVTIHAYSPPIRCMGAYAVRPDGDIRRRTVEWDVRLEPALV